MAMLGWEFSSTVRSELPVRGGLTTKKSGSLSDLDVVKEMGRLVLASNEEMYERLWQARIRFMDKVLDEGEKNLYRALKRFQELDRLYRIIVLQLETEFTTPDGDKRQISTMGDLVQVSEKKLISEKDRKIPFDRKQTVVEFGKKRETFHHLDYQSLVPRWLLDMLDDSYDAIVELGSGYGRNLFEIYYNGGPGSARYFAAEYTESGRAMTERFAALDEGLPLETVFFDHRNPDLSFLAPHDFKKVFLFSCHSIEQVSEIPDSYFPVLAGVAPQVLGVHFEPFGFQVSAETELAKEHREFILDKEYNLNFYERLKQAADGVLEIRYMRKDVIAPQLINPTSVAVWEKQGEKGG